ncbi:metallophosphoesterase family protein [Sporosarcina sp. FSL W7-1349]|uniref:metallophosphoesterase family protein n=1 Tax=Sporosarcina sp. FSL W7-1349 TaxID=2921561 RepID=UPI0030FC6F17
MKYALLGDIHSSKEDLDAVLDDIEAKAPDAIRVGTGDLFECTISKKDVKGQTYTKMEDVMLLPDGFEELLTFLSVRGNQEERILQLTETADVLREKLATMPETFSLSEAEIVHGHQWQWGGEPWSLIRADVERTPVFYGHSHKSGLRRRGVETPIEFGTPYPVTGEEVLVNVGAVVGDREWALYDLADQTVTFMKA